MEMSIANAIASYLDSVRLARSPNTAKTYRFGMQMFKAVLTGMKIDPEMTQVANLTEDAIIWLAAKLRIPPQLLSGCISPP